MTENQHKPTGPHVDFYFDVVCPYAYLANTQIAAQCERAGAGLRWIPVLLGGLFREVGAGDGPMASMSPDRARQNLLDVTRWADHFDVPLNLPSHHPRRSVLAMRALLASGDIPRAAKALFTSYWVNDEDIAVEAVVAESLSRAGFAGRDVLAKAGTDDTKNLLRANTSEAAAAGAFGVPSFVVYPPPSSSRGPALIWGQDRMHFIDAALRGELLAELPEPQVHGVASQTGEGR